MSAIRATWTNGKILPREPVDWPEGSDLLVEQISSEDGGDLVPGDNMWGDDPGSIAAWTAAVNRIEPMVWVDGEREEFEAYRERVRQLTIEAVRKQMAETPGGAKA